MNQRHFSLRLACFLLLLFCGVFASRTHAQLTNVWVNAASSFWESPGNWSLGAPAMHHTVVITNAGTRIVTVDHISSATTNAMTVSNLVVGGTATGTNTLSLQNATNAPLTILRDVSIGTNAVLTLNNSRMQMTGANSQFFNDGTMTLQNGSVFYNRNFYNVGSSGTGVLNMTNSLMTNQTMILGGNGARGTVNQVGGSNLLWGLGVGEGFGGSGTYNLSGGYLSANGLYVGDHGTGVFNQVQGSVRATELGVGELSQSHGTYNLTNGSLTTDRMFIGHVSTGTLNQNGGSVTNLDGLYVGYNSGSTGVYNMVNGYMTAGAGIYLGVNGQGTINQNGGTLNSTFGIVVAEQAGSRGAYNLTNATLVAADFLVGYRGIGSVYQSGGRVTNFNAGLSLGIFSGSSGTYTLGSGSLLVANNGISVGDSGTGVFNNQGGTNLAGTVAVGVGSGSGTYFLFGGTLAAGQMTVGLSGNGTFGHGGGTATFTNAGVTLGEFSTAIGQYTLTFGTLQTPRLTLGYDGRGTFDQGAGTVRAGHLMLAERANSVGDYAISSGSLEVSNAIVGGAGNGRFSQSGGSVWISNQLVLAQQTGSTGNYLLSGGFLRAKEVVVNAGGAFRQVSGNLFMTNALNRGTWSLEGGQMDGNLTNTGAFRYSGGSFLGRLINYGALEVATPSMTLGRGLANHVSYTLSNQTLVLNGPGLANESTFTLAGGTLSLNAGTNNGFLSGYGTITGAGGLINNSLMAVDGGTLTFSTTVASENRGNFDLSSAHQLRLEQGGLVNRGSLNMNSGTVTGPATLSNEAGGTISGRGTIASGFANNGGVIAVESGTLNVVNGFANSGSIALGGIAATIAGGGIANSGSIAGFGNVGNAVTNDGTIEAIGGTLTLGGAVSNGTAGVITAGSGSRVLITGGLANNDGLIALSGGTFDNNNRALNNNGNISGFGTFRASHWRNAGRMTFAGGHSTIVGSVHNNAGQRIEIAHSSALFTGNVTNFGVFKTTGASVTFAGLYVENGSYISDPSDNYFNDLILGATGYLIGGLGDRFFVAGDFLNQSTRNALWDTDEARLSFNGGGNHLLQLAGIDRGRTGAGYLDNFSWGILELGNGQTLMLQDGNAEAGGAIYVRSLFLGGGTNQIASITGNGLNIYYDATRAENAYLNGQTYSLTGGGELAPISEVLRITFIDRTPSQATIRFEELPGRTHTVQFSVNLVTWTNVSGATYTSPSPGTLQWVDNGSLTGGLPAIRFYRVLAE
jgi:hypothetical protein